MSDRKNNEMNGAAGKAQSCEKDDTHDVGEITCSACAHACAVSVERSYTHVRCGNAACVNCGKWTRPWNSHPRKCLDFAQATPERGSAFQAAWRRSGDILMELIVRRCRRHEGVRPERPAIPANVDSKTYRAYVPVEGGK